MAACSIAHDLFDIMDADKKQSSILPDYETDNVIEDDNVIETDNNEKIEFEKWTDEDFKKQAIKIIQHVKISKTFFKFPSALSNERRRLVHEIAENYNIIHYTTGTRYKCITVSFSDICFEPQLSRQKTASLLAKASIVDIPNYENVTDTIASNTVHTGEKKPRGRPPGTKNKTKNVVDKHQYNLRNK